MSDLDKLYGDGGGRKTYDYVPLLALVVSFLLLAAYGCGYALFSVLTSGILTAETASIFAAWLPTFFIGAVVSALVCIPMRWMKNKIVLPAAMAFLILYYIVLVIAFLTSDAVTDRALDIYVLSFYCLPCIIPGNAISWLMYRKLRR